MLSFDEPRWGELRGGYQMPFDPRPVLAQLAAGSDIEDAWHELWENLHHQDDVEIVRAILSILALAKGVRTHGKFLINYSEEEMLEFESKALG